MRNSLLKIEHVVIQCLITTGDRYKNTVKEFHIMKLTEYVKTKYISVDVSNCKNQTVGSHIAARCTEFQASKEKI